jgi:hypothetical protein
MFCPIFSPDSGREHMTSLSYMCRYLSKNDTQTDKLGDSQYATR